MKIEFNHSKKRLARALGVEEDREYEIRDLCEEYWEKQKYHKLYKTTSEKIEAITKVIKPTSVAEYMYIGFCVSDEMSMAKLNKMKDEVMEMVAKEIEAKTGIPVRYGGQKGDSDAAKNAKKLLDMLDKEKKDSKPKKIVN